MISRVLIILFLLSSSASAESFGVAHQFIKSSFRPKLAFALQEIGPGQVLQYPAKSFLPSEPWVGEKEYIVGTKIFTSELSNRQVSRFAFFLIDEEGAFFAAPVSNWKRKDLESNTTPLNELKVYLTELNDRLRDNRGKLDAKENNLAVLRKQAAKIAGVKGIVDLKLELEEIDSVVATASFEQKRLKELVLLGRKSVDPADAKLWRRDLSAQLKQAAQATAMADRLNERRREAAFSSLRQKQQLIQETRKYDPKALAKEVLKLRKQRRELENRLNISLDPSNSDF